MATMLDPVFEGMTPEERTRSILLAARDLVTLADVLGVSLRIDRRPLLPLSMGNARHVVEAWPARHQPPSGCAGL